MNFNDQRIPETAEIADAIKSLNKIQKGIFNLQLQQQRDRHRLTLHSAMNETNYNSVFYGSVIETAVFVLVSLFQVSFHPHWFPYIDDYYQFVYFLHIIYCCRCTLFGDGLQVKCQRKRRINIHSIIFISIYHCHSPHYQIRATAAASDAISCSIHTIVLLSLPSFC